MKRAFAALAAILLLAGCASNDGVAGQVGDAGYVSGDGVVTEIAPENRGEPIEFGGETIDGEEWTSSTGSVTVVNFWYAACAPCRAEAPLLAELYETHGDEVTFIGVNTRDGAAQAEAFDANFGIGYPSILDARSARAQLAFSGTVAPNAVPTTLVLDREGRVASRISGAISDTSILDALIRTELDR